MGNRTKVIEEEKYTPRKRILTPEVKLEKLYRRLADDPKFTHLRYRHRLITGQGTIRPIAMIVVEMPEPNDEHIGVALTGPAGIVLHEMLAAADIKRASHTFVTPVVKYRPHGGREVTKGELAAFLPYLQQEIAIVDPHHIVTCGRFVNNLFFPGKPLSETRGQILPWKGRLVMPTLHPLSAMHDPQNRLVMLETFRMLGDLV